MVPTLWRLSKNKPPRGRRARLKHSARPTVEPLESRWVPAGPTFRETAIPTASAFPYGVAFGPDNNIWFTESQKGKIGVINLGGTILHEYNIPSIGGFPNEIILGPDKNLWFSELNAGVIGTITVTGAVTEYTIPSALSQPRGLTIGPDGNIWFAESNTHKIGKVSTSGVFTEYALPSGNNPQGITLGPDGHIWYTAPSAGVVGKLTINADGSVSTNEYVFRDSFGNLLDPTRITTGPDGALWFTEFMGDRIGRITPDGVTRNNFLVPTSLAEPFEIVSNTDNSLWFTEFNGNKIGQIKIDGTFKEYTVPTANSFPLGITTDVSKNLWFTENSADNIGELILPPTHLGVTAPASSTAGTPFTITVSALNDAGGVAPGYLGKVHLASTDMQAVLPPDYQFTTADFSTHTFTNKTTLKTAGNQIISAADLQGTLTSGNATVTVTAAAPSQLSAKFSAISTTAGVPTQFTVSALDPYGNVAPSYVGTVHFTSSDPQDQSAPPLPADYQFVPGDNGVHVFNIQLFTAGTQTVTVTDTSTSTETATASINVTASTLDHLGISVMPPIIAGTPFTPTVAGVDAYGNVISSYQGTITFSSTDPNATLPGQYTFLPADKGSHAFTNGATLRTAGSMQISVQDVNTATLKGSITLTVNPGAPAQIQVVPSPTTVTAGNFFSLTVTVQDQFTNTVTGYRGTVFFKTSDPKGTPPGAYTFLATDNGSHVFSAILRTAGAQTITATDSTNSTITGSGGVTVKPASFDHLALTGTTTPTAGAPFTVTVTTQDAFNNQTTGYTGKIHFSLMSPDPGAILPPDFQFVSGNNGQQVFPNGVTLKTAGSQTVKIQDTSIAFYNAKLDVVVNPAAADHLSVSMPATATAGTAVDATITALDPFNNRATNYSGTVHFSSSDATATLPADYTFLTTDNGQHVFKAAGGGGVTFRKAGTQSVAVADTGAGSINGSTSVTVSAAATSTFLVAGFPSPAAAGTTGTFSVTATDAFGNITPNYKGTVLLSSTDNKAVLMPASYQFLSSDAGVHSFTATLNTAGSQKLTATDKMNNSITGSQSITINPGAMTGILLSGFPSPIIAGTPGTFTVASVDTFGNTAPGYLGTVHFTSSDPQAALPGDYTFKPSDQGQASFTATLNTLGTQSLTATDTTTSSLTSTQSNINVTNPVPVATSLSVSSAAEGSPALSLTVNGSRFIATSVVLVNGAPVSTTYQSSTQLQATIPAANLADEGKLTLTVSNPAPGGGTSAGLTFTVQDAALTATNTSPSLVEGTTFSGTIASFTDGNAGARASDFTAAIDWGDGTSSKGTVVTAAGGFAVQGSKTFNEEGSNTITVTIQDVGGASATITSVATVADASLSAAGAGVNEREFVALSRVVVATFTDAGGNQPVTNFTASINWGDGTPASQGMVSQLGSTYRVEGTHTFTAAGPYAISVAVQDDGGATAKASTAVTIGDDSLLISGAYHDVLGRAVDVGGYDGFKLSLDSSRATLLGPIAGSFVTSPEERGKLVSSFYTNLLGRQASPDDVNSGVQALQQGVTPEQIMATIVGSPEYFQRQGGTNSAWLDHVYLDLLGRSRNGEGQTLLNMVNSGTPRSAVAAIVLSTTEYRMDVITSAYLTYLGRQPQAGDFAAWLPVLGRGSAGPGAPSPREQLLIGVLSSTEYFQVTGDTNQSWASSLYTKLLGRQPDQANYASIVNSLISLEAGFAHNLAAALTGSTEHRTNLVLGYYAKFLGRTPASNSAEVSGWVNAMAAGTTDEQVIVAFVSSDEYFLKQGGQIRPWLDQAYLDVLGRPRGSNETGLLSPVVQGSLTRPQAIALMTGSQEYRQDLITAYFGNLLGRQPSGDDITTWLQNLQNGTTDEQFATTLIGTPEYLGRQHLFP